MMLRASARYFVQASFFVALTVAMVSAQDSLGSSYCQAGAGCVTTFHNDLARDGVYGNETTLKASSFTGFSGLTTVALDGLVYAQPLYIRGLKGITAGSGCNHTLDNVIFAATENNTVYAINPAGNICWQVTLDASIGSAVPYDSLPLDSDNNSGNFCNNIVAQAGITGTPVIDTSITPPILYVVTKVALANGGGYAHKLHALRTDTHAELPHSPVDVTTALGSSAFNSILQNQRAGLALTVSGSTASVYVTFGSDCDSNYISGSGLQSTVYNGLTVEFQYTYFGNSAPTVSTFKAETTANDSNKGGIWMAGGAPAVDTSGNLYVTVGNGFYDGVDEWGESVLRL